MKHRGLPLLLLIVTSLAYAQPQPPARDRTPELPSVAPLLSGDADRLEQEIITLAQQRATAPAGVAAYLELQIDLRVYARWLIAQTTAGARGSDVQIVGYLRSRDALALVAEIDRWVAANAARTPTRLQAEAMIRFRQQTYRLPKSVALPELDSQNRQATVHLVGALSAGEIPQLPVMRPRVQPTTRPAAPTTGPVERMTLPELAERVRQMSLSPQLRAQLQTLITATQTAENADEQKTLRDAIDIAVDLAAGLQTNVAVEPADRIRLEQQLTDAVTLYADPRLRDAGERRLRALSDFRKLLARIGSLRLPPDVMQQLAPAFVYARANPRDGATVLQSIETFSQQMQRASERRVNSPVPDNYRRSLEDILRQIPQQRQSFQAAAAQLGNRSIMQESAESLAGIASELVRLNDVADAIIQMPATLDRLASYRPRPTGGLERRVITAIVQSSNAEPSASRAEASRLLVDLTALHDTARSLEAQLDAIPAPRLDALTGGRATALRQKLRDSVTSIASTVADGGQFDGGAFARVRALGDLIEHLSEAAAIESKLADRAGLTRWADWTVPPEGMLEAIRPYRAALADSAAAFVGDDERGMMRAGRARQRYRALLDTLTHTASFAEACAALPEGQIAILARLATPSDRQPFEVQRIATVGIELLLHQRRTDPQTADEVLAALTARLDRAQR